MLFADITCGREFAKDPAVVKLSDRYYMYYSKNTPNAPWRIGIAVSDDMELWSVVGEIEPQAGCEENGICAPGAILSGDTLHLFYQTYGNAERDAICHAVSKDGINFVRDDTNPIFRPTGAWNCGRAIDADVIAFHGKLFLYFATRDPEMKRQMLGVACADIDSGFHRQDFTQCCEASILKPELDWEQECIEAPAVCEYHGRLYLFYGGAYNNHPQQIGCAVSMDGLSFKRVSESPILPCGKKGEWNSCESGHPFIYREGERYHIFYQGNSDFGKSWYISRAEVRFENLTPYIVGQ